MPEKSSHYFPIPANSSKRGGEEKILETWIGFKGKDSGRLDASVKRYGTAKKKRSH